MRILLAGAGGVIGRRLVPLLVARGHTVFGTTRRPDRRDVLKGLGAEPLLMDALDRSSVESAIGDAAPDLIVHQLTDLANLDFGGNARIRILGTRNLVDTARDAGVERMIAQGIAWVFPPAERPATEADPIDDSTPGIPELETAVAELPHGIVLRYGMLYGPGTWFAAGAERVQEAREGRLSSRSELTPFLHVDDAASATVDALEWPSGPVNIVDDEPAHAADWIAAFAAAAGAPAQSPPSPTEAGRAVSNALARSRGWAPAYPTWRTGFPAALQD